jgi:tRNA-specific 2-thiouridylase
MDRLAFEHHLLSPQGRDRVPSGAPAVTAGPHACRDEIRLGVLLEEEQIADAGFEAHGCGAATAAASAAVTLIRGAHLFEAARIGPDAIAAELGGLSAAKHHAAELAADAVGRALGAAVRASAELAEPASGERTLVAMSGGVDSAVAALRCAQQGETVALTLELWSDSENDGELSCCSASAVAQARALAHSMGLAHITLDLREEFRAGVVEPFIAGYAGGETPNPCVGCNGHVRLDAMLELADRLGCRRLATGHYARLTSDGLLRLAADPAKDQTYMLAALSANSLARMRFPLGDLVKSEVRSMAADAGLPVAGKADSQDLCFLAGTDRRSFLARHGHLGDRPGEFVDSDGAVVGSHDGQHNFTVGQRRGLYLSGPEPLYVLAKDAATNAVRVGPRSALAADRVTLRGVRLHRSGDEVDRVKLRYRSQMLPGTLLDGLEPGWHRTAELVLADPTDGVAPGQLACLMSGDAVIGTATIAMGALASDRPGSERAA